MSPSLGLIERSVKDLAFCLKSSETSYIMVLVVCNGMVLSQFILQLLLTEIYMCVPNPIEWTPWSPTDDSCRETCFNTYQYRTRRCKTSTCRGLTKVKRMCRGQKVARCFGEFKYHATSTRSWKLTAMI